MVKKNTINEARIPANKQVGQHLFKGLRYDSNGNPLYTCDTLSNEEARAMGWKFSPKYGLYGQLSDPTMFYESKKKIVRLTESDLKRVITESVKKVLKEGIKTADAMNATSPELAKECGFELEYENVNGGFQLWGGPLPEDKQEKTLLLRKLGIKKFTSENYMNGTCRITVDPSGKIANIGKKSGHPILMKLAELLKQNKISSDKAVQILVSKGFDENKARTWVTKYTPNAIHESNEMFNEKEIDDYINMRASSNKKMQDIRIKYKHLYGSMIFDYSDLSSFFDAMIAQGEEIPVKDVETYERAKMMNQKANKILFQYKEMLKGQKPSPKEELLNGEQWQYHDLYNRI